MDYDMETNQLDRFYFAAWPQRTKSFLISVKQNLRYSITQVLFFESFRRPNMLHGVSTVVSVFRVFSKHQDMTLFEFQKQNQL